MSRDLESRIRSVVKRWTPKGFKIRDTADPWEVSCINTNKTIVCPPLVDRYALGCFLHEVGHFILRHFDANIPRWQEEYEADQFAMRTMRDEGIAVPAELVTQARYNVRCMIEKAMLADPDLDVDDNVLRFAYPDNWRVIRDGEPLRRAA